MATPDASSIVKFDRVWKPGDQIPAGLINAIVRQLVGALTAAGQGGAVSAGRLGFRDIPGNGAARILLGKIAVTGTAGLHKWVEQEPKDDGTDWQVAQGGIDASTTDATSVAAQARTIDGTSLLADSKVYIYEGTNHDGHLSYWILGSASNEIVPIFQGQGIFATASNTKTASYPFFVDP